LPGDSSTLGLTGSRIRERREIAGMRQAELARAVGISASYLNLIEHNRRRIGGILLVKLARTLGVEPTQLTEGAEAAFLAALREAATESTVEDVETGRAEELAGRFPGWARLVVEQQSRLKRLEQVVEGLHDRLSHDPALAASVHEVLSTAASIRSTAAILASGDALDANWLARFHANIDEDSARLAESSRALARYLERGGEVERVNVAGTPQDEVDSFLESRGFRFDSIESGVEAPDVVADRAGLSRSGRMMLLQVLEGYAADAALLPLARLSAELSGDARPDPAALARVLGVPVAVVLRRLASLSEHEAGYVMCDRSGRLLLRKALPGFSVPRNVACCPLWPLFMALTQTGTLIRRRVVRLGRHEVTFDCIAVTEETGQLAYNMPPLMLAGMLIQPAEHAAPTGVEEALRVGATCRLCSRAGCPARQEPSVLDMPA
jgi:transcriptional regulator with XRE-family HTH domain